MAKEAVEHPIGDIEIHKLTDVTAQFAGNFDCGIKDLNDFIRDDALVQQKESVNITYLWVSKASKELLGYISLCTDSIHLTGEKKEEMKKMGVSYKALPALKICRMAVNKNYFCRKIGTKMIAFAINLALGINRKSACRYLTLEAKNDHALPEEKRPLHFYKKAGFLVLKERKESAAYIPMYKDLMPLIRESTNLELKKTFGSA